MIRAFAFVVGLLFAVPALAADFIAVMSYDGSNRVEKYGRFGTQAAADAHVAAFIGQYTDAFVTSDPGSSADEWLVDPVAHTISISATPVVPPSVISFDDFEARFTAGEWDAATDHVYEADTATGLPKRRALLQNHSRAIARNSVDLHDDKTANFMAALVAGGVVTQARSDTISSP